MIKERIGIVVLLPRITCTLILAIDIDKIQIINAFFVKSKMIEKLRFLTINKV
jgi:hypothetical protein